MSTQTEHSLIAVGRVTGLFGVQGWLKISSYTDPTANILNYQPWELTLGSTKLSVWLAASEVHAKGIVVQFKGYEDRELARQLLGAQIDVTRAQLPALPEEQYYWTDLEGMTVVTQNGVTLGTVAYLFATGANDVLVVKGERERFIPYIPQQVILHVDLSTRVMQVDWDPEF